MATDRLSLERSLSGPTVRFTVLNPISRSLTFLANDATPRRPARRHRHDLLMTSHENRPESPEWVSDSTGQVESPLAAAWVHSNPAGELQSPDHTPASGESCISRTATDVQNTADFRSAADSSFGNHDIASAASKVAVCPVSRFEKRSTSPSKRSRISGTEDFLSSGVGELMEQHCSVNGRDRKKPFRNPDEFLGLGRIMAGADLVENSS